jgi:glycosyltransferase involved in cell wall biosynthesis
MQFQIIKYLLTFFFRVTLHLISLASSAVQFIVDSGEQVKVAIVHYWFVGMRGGEKVVEEICRIFPQADIFTLVLDRKALSDTILMHPIKTSFLQKLGGAKHYQKMLPLMPFALESFDLTGYDLVISSEAGPAKSIVTRPDAVHICYCHSPMRYLWDLSHQYLSNSGRLARMVMQLTFPWLRQWDLASATRVDHFIANSAFVARRIRKYYRRDSAVIHPPVSVERFSISRDVDDFYLCAGQITPYKKVEVAVEACTALGRKLVVLGSGASKQLKAAAGPTITFLEKVDDATMEYHFSHCKALLYPGMEDFGIVPLEAMASGRPVIAYGRGGALETVVDRKTGMFFYEQTAQSLSQAMLAFEAAEHLFDAEEIRRHAQLFSATRFRQELSNFINGVLETSELAPSRSRTRDGVQGSAVITHFPLPLNPNSLN